MNCTTDELLPILQASKAGREIEQRYSCGDGKWSIAPKDPIWDFQVMDYRIKPKPKRVPLGPEDVPPGSVVRRLGTEHYCLVLDNRPTCCTVYTGIMISASWQDLFGVYEISRDAGKTWSPCWKQVEE